MRRRATQSAAPLAAFLLVLATLASCASPASTTRSAKEPPGPPLTNFPCKRTIDAFIAPAGLKSDQLDDVKIRTESIAGGDQVAYYRVSARPQTCGGGWLDMIILPDCSVDSWRTTPPCRLQALEPAG